MKKIIELTPEWVLDKLSDSFYAGGDGIVNVYSSGLSDANWIELALRTLKISFEESEFFDDDNNLLFNFTFKLEDINVDCPTLYNSLKVQDMNNRKRNLKFNNYEKSN